MLLLVVIATLVVLGGATELPNSFDTCKAGDVKCLADVMTKFIRTHPDGLPKVGLKPLDPLFFGDATIHQQADGPLSMNITITDGSILGWRNMTVTKVVGFDKDPKTSKFEIHAQVPIDTILGTYDLSAKALLIPVTGHGSVNLTFENLQMIVKLKTKIESRNDEDYLVIKKVNVLIEVQKMYSDFSNLFSNMGLSDNTNSLLNEYQEQLFMEIRHSFGIARGTVLQKYLSPFFAEIPYRKLFAE